MAQIPLSELSDGDRAALQALVPLAGALGAGTIFALFFGGRRKAGFAVFELFTIVWPRIPLLRKRARMGFHLLEPSRGGEARLVELEPNDEGVFDITKLGVI